MPVTSASVYGFSGGSPLALRRRLTSASVASGSLPRMSASKRMSSARRRAFLRAAIRQFTRPRYDPSRVSTLTRVPDSMNSGTGDGGPGLQRCRLGPAGGAIALQPGLGVGDLQLHRCRQLHVQRLPVMRGDDDFLALQQVVRGPTHGLIGNRQLVVGGGVHEDPVRAVAVQVLHGPLVDVGGVDLDPGVEGLVHDLAGQHVLQLRAHESAALAGLDVLELHHCPELAVEVEDESVLQIVRRCHRCFRSVVARRGPSARWSTRAAA